MLPSSTVLPRHVLIVADGSGGDVYPHIALGSVLQKRGHRVTCIMSSYFEDAVREAQLELVSAGSIEEARAVADERDLWRVGRGLRILSARMLEAMPRVYRLVAERYVPGETVVVGNFSALGARVAREKLGVPMATVHLQPVLLRSRNVQPGLTLSDRWRPVVRTMRKGLLAVLDRWLFDPMLAPGLNAFRASLGLPSVARVFDSWIHSPDLVIGFFPEWFAARQPDWPSSTHLVGFPLADPGSRAELPDDVARFLEEEEGEPPLVFTLGTAMRFGSRFFEVSVDVCRLLKCRGILLTRFAEQLPQRLPPGVRHFAHVPFSRLLPRAAALVHHGGIGTIAHALAAGIPQLVMPFNFDQPDNAAHVRRLAVGDTVWPRAYETQRVARKLTALMSSASVTARCHDVANRCQDSQSLVHACELIESLGAADTRGDVPRRGGAFTSS